VAVDYGKSIRSAVDFSETEPRRIYDALESLAVKP
jgi:hypothetical protein